MQSVKVSEELQKDYRDPIVQRRPQAGACGSLPDGEASQIEENGRTLASVLEFVCNVDRPVSAPNICERVIDG